MALLRKTFIGGRMNADLDERILPDGVYKHANNIEVLNSESSDEGAVQNSYSNKLLTNLNIGVDVITIGWFEDHFRDKIYWATKSEIGCFVLEWDEINKLATIVLGDTRIGTARVLDFKEDYLCTGWDKINSEDPSKDLMLMTDDNIQPLCFNIERAKGYGINGFTKEDIFLIKKPPRFAPKSKLIYSDNPSNNIEEKFPRFSYRYQYLDDEWSALSTYTNPQFSPRPYNIDYYSLDNNGMVNNFNAVNLTINTGDKRVKAIQIIFKECNSNVPYIIETFNKSKLKWSDNVLESFIFSNNKLYIALPVEEVYRSFDNVPLKAKALTIIGNRPIFGNYVEQFDILDEAGNKINIDFEVLLKSTRLDVKNSLAVTSTNTTSINYLQITNPNNYILAKKSVLIFNLFILKDTNIVYNFSYEYELIESFLNLKSLFISNDFVLFISLINKRFNENNTYVIENGYTVFTEAKISAVVNSANNVSLKIEPLIIKNASNISKTIAFSFGNTTNVLLSNISNASSCKSIQDYEFGLIYLDEFNRSTTVLTTIYNNFNIPIDKSKFKNEFTLRINNKPPAFADRYKICVKTPTLSYHIITVNTFFQDGAFVWIKLEGADKDKVQAGDYLILKRTPLQISGYLLKTKVLEAGVQDKDFLGATLGTEPFGYYIKIKPNGFVMKFYELSVLENAASSRSDQGFPICRLDLFTTVAGATVTNITLKAGTKLTLKIDSSFDYDGGASTHIFEREYIMQRDYGFGAVAGLKEWYDEIVDGTSMPALGDGGNYLGLVQYVTVDSKDYLQITGLESGGSEGRGGFVNAWITIRQSSGDYIFETESKINIDQNIFFETAETFEIINNQHKGNVSDQNGYNPAIIDLDFLNCFSMGNGVESYMIKDSFNKPFLNIDSRPSAVSLKEYKQVRRFADFNYGETYSEGGGVNAINEFNLSKGNFAELDKQFGSIQRLISRENDIVIYQEKQISKIGYGKDYTYNADGSANLISISQVLGKQIPYMGDNGVGVNPESIVVNNYQIYSVYPKKGIIQRLSNDGITDITTGLVDFFRDLFIENPNAKVLGGYDPYFSKYILSVGDNKTNDLEFNCGNIIYKTIESLFSYTLNTNKIVGDIIFNYHITQGSATITVLYDNTTTVVSNVSGIGNIVVPVLDKDKSKMKISIIPVSDIVEISIVNNCPIPNHFSSLHFSSLHFST